ncbi:MAG: DUF547 domain-containing protein [Pseudomonadota bacterium]
MILLRPRNSGWQSKATLTRRFNDTPDGSAVQRVALSTLGTLLALAGFVIPCTIAMAQESMGPLEEADTTWTNLLKECVVEINDGGGTAVNYDCFAENQSTLNRYLETLSGVDRNAYNTWGRDDQLAYLINAYNAYTVDLILDSWPDIESIRDLGNIVFNSPWKKEFIPLFGETVALDDIEHGMIREAGVFDEPRIHFAVNCASIGCPALRREAYHGKEIDAQLEDQVERFLGDRTRNRFEDGELKVTRLFKWYRDDFTTGWRGATSVEEFTLLYAEVLGLNEQEAQRLLDGDIDIEYTEYDWALNGL